jgi:hypothetical protein
VELKQVVCESTLVVYIEGLVNDYIQKEFSYIDEEEKERLYMTVFNFVVSYYSCSQRPEDSIAIRFYIRLAVERNFRYINSALMYSKSEKDEFAKDIYNLVIQCSKQDFTKHLKPFTIKKQCEKQDCDGCKCEK